MGAIKGYKVIITLPEKMSSEKVAVLRALGATIVRTPTKAASDSPESHIGVAKQLNKTIPNSHILDQYENVENPNAHEYGTAEEIWEQTNGKVTVVVAGAGTGGTISGLTRGLHKHNKDIRTVSADPYGSAMAWPDSLNTERLGEGYKIEGIGYDFRAPVLDHEAVTKWYKTDDREAFMFSRRLIREEGLLVGGSSGAAMAAMVRCCKDFHLTKDDVVVVVLPDSIRSYLSKFADDDWLAANDLLPEVDSTSPVANLPTTNGDSHKSEPKPEINGDAKDPYHGKTVGDLRLKEILCVTADTTCAEACETMRDKGFDQLPVLDRVNGKLVGLVTLGNILAYMSKGRATGDTLVSKVMFDFSHLDEKVPDPRDMGKGANGDATRKKRPFFQITMETPLAALGKFFEWNSAAVVTRKEEDKVDGQTRTWTKPIAVVTKVDLLTYLVKLQAKEVKA
jgi:cystathionine beta-synthase